MIVANVIVERLLLLLMMMMIVFVLLLLLKILLLLLLLLQQLLLCHHRVMAALLPLLPLLLLLPLLHLHLLQCAPLRLWRQLLKGPLVRIGPGVLFRVVLVSCAVLRDIALLPLLGGSVVLDRCREERRRRGRGERKR